LQRQLQIWIRYTSLLLLFLILQNPAKSQENSNFQKAPYAFTGKFNEDPSESPFRFNILQNIQVIEGLSDEARIEDVSQN